MSDYYLKSCSCYAHKIMKKRKYWFDKEIWCFERKESARKLLRNLQLIEAAKEGG